MRKINHLAIIFALLSAAPVSAQRYSSWVYPGNDGKLVYKAADGKGNKIVDFSYAGYRGGGVALPKITGPVVNVAPVAGDDTANIQAAIDQVAAMPIDPATGYRGVVQLSEDTYQVKGGEAGVRDGRHLFIEDSGIILRGMGKNEVGGTTIKATGNIGGENHPPIVIEVKGNGNRQEVDGTRRGITDTYVPRGARSFSVSDPSVFAVGNKIIVERVTSQSWIDHIGMDKCDNRGGTSYDDSDVSGESCMVDHWTWASSNKNLEWDRIITNINGSVITVDAPITQAIESRFGGGRIWKYTYSGRIENVGIENLRGESDFVSGDDENHAWTFITMNHVQNAWIDDVQAKYFAYALVVLYNTKWVTVEDSKCYNMKSKIDGGRRYPFKFSDCELCLVHRCEASEGRHSFVCGSTTMGPNVFLNNTATNCEAASETHSDWNSGVLYDNVKDEAGIQIRNRGDAGGGHGWSGANSVLWNCKGSKDASAWFMWVARPRTAFNWAIGGGTDNKNAYGGTGGLSGFFEHVGTWSSPTYVTPDSLYLAQLQERLGPDAVSNIGYTPAATQPIMADNAERGVMASASWSTGTSATGEFGSNYGYRPTAAVFDEAISRFSKPAARTYHISAR